MSARGVLVSKVQHYPAASQSGGVSMRILSRIKKEEVLYTLHTADIPTTSGTLLFTFADDITIMATHEDPKIAHNMLQQHLSVTTLYLHLKKELFLLLLSTMLVYRELKQSNT